MKILNLVILLFLFTSCGSSFLKQQKKFIEFAGKYPTELARLCSDRFPSTPIYIAGKTDTIEGEKIYIKGDSIPCPDGSKVKAPDKQVDCPPSFNTRDTIKVPDNARIYILNRTIADLQNANDQLRREYDEKMKKKDEEIKKLKEENDNLKSKSNKRLYVIIALSFIIGLCIFLKIKRII